MNDRWRWRLCAAYSLLMCCAGVYAQTAPRAGSGYGFNATAGKTFSHDGVRLYYEVYGAGTPLLMIHPNGGSIRDMSAQIDYFRKHYRVIAMDSRDHGRSGDSAGRLTYEKMADDLAALLQQLQTPPANVLGWSDGGIEALLLGIRHPEKVAKIASMAANLNPEGIHPEALALIRGTNAQGKRERRVNQLMLDEPHIDPRALEAIRAPTLVMASDHDMIADEHTLGIYHHLRNGQLCIFPNATHTVAYDDPMLFNTTVERFFSTPFVKRDRIQDALRSFDALRR